MPELNVSNVGRVRLLTLNRPQVRNALSRSLRGGLLRALEEAAVDETVRSVVLTGAGDAFCAGLDLGELQESLTFSAERHRADSRALADLFLFMMRFPKPLVAAVNGHAVAGGAGLVSACDLAVMAEGAKFGYTEARIGFVAALVSVLLVRQVGEKQARDLLLSARLISSAEALTMGLVNEVAPQAAVLPRALEHAALMSENAPGSLKLTKELLGSVPGLSLEDGLRLAVEVNTVARSGRELEEGVRAFLEKRAPSWQQMQRRPGGQEGAEEGDAGEA